MDVSYSLTALAEMAATLDGRDDLLDRCGRLRPRTDSQDAWLFRAPAPALGVDFELGRAKCDNHVAAVLQKAGYDVVAPSLALRPMHVQDIFREPGGAPADGGRPLKSYTSPDEIRGATAYVSIADQWVF